MAYLHYCFLWDRAGNYQDFKILLFLKKINELVKIELIILFAYTIDKEKNVIMLQNAASRKCQDSRDALL